MGQVFEVRHYCTADGRIIVGEWLRSLRNKEAKARVITRFSRLSLGNFGDHRALRDGVWELRIDTGPGYRVYYALAGKTCVLLLCGGDKNKQSSDIERAVAYWKDYKKRSASL